MYYVRRPFQLSQAHKANIDYRIGRFYAPETARWQWSDDDYTHWKKIIIWKKIVSLHFETQAWFRVIACVSAPVEEKINNIKQLL